MTGCRWDEEKKTWTIETKSDQSYEANILIQAVGPFPAPLIPEFKVGNEMKETQELREKYSCYGCRANNRQNVRSSVFECDDVLEVSKKWPQRF